MASKYSAKARPADGELYPIRTVSTLTGVNPITLRAWERRYGLVKPVRTAGGNTTYLRDVAFVRDGFSPQTNIVRQDGQRGVLLSVLKNGGASTLDIVDNLRAMLPRVQALGERIATQAPALATRIVARWVGGAVRYASA